MFRPSRPECFFCQTVVNPPPRDPRNFKCSACQCYNRYDASGEIVSEEAAMHEEALNARSFARRASPRKDRFLSSYGNNIFCHTCQTNQMLLTNLLSNYLPSPDDPDYEKRVEMLPDYQASVERRYPPVCAACLPAVEEEIGKRNHMARTNALGRWLKQSKGKQKQTAATVEDLVHFDRDLKMWKLRGCLWLLTLVGFIAGNTAVALLQYQPSSNSTLFTRILPAFGVSAFPLVCLWNPTYAPIKRAQHQGRDLRLQGGTAYITCQMLIWLSRLTTCVLLFLSSSGSQRDFLHLQTPEVSSRPRLYFSGALILELLILITSISILRVHTPPAIRLIDPSGRSSSASPLTANSTREKLRFNAPTLNPAPHESDLLASLTLSTKPVIRTNPVFGIPSLHQSPITPSDQDDPDAMDWTPTNPSPKKGAVTKGYEDDLFVKPQRFFAPEEPTGLEPLLARTNLVEGFVASPISIIGQRLPGQKVRWYYWMCALVLVPVTAGALYYLRAYSGITDSTVHTVVERAPEVFVEPTFSIPSE